MQARYEILRSCLAELQRVGLVAGGATPQPWEELRVMINRCMLSCSSPFGACIMFWGYILTATDVTQYGQPPDAATSACSQALMSVARGGEGLSGRTLRKLPLLAWQRHPCRGSPHSCAEFIALLNTALNAERADRLSCGVTTA
jgi:hypothetical protein